MILEFDDLSYKYILENYGNSVLIKAKNIT